MKEKSKNERIKKRSSQEETSASLESSEERQRAAEQHVRGVLIRGEAAKPIRGKLPPGATHEIVRENPGELPTIRRRRFSTY